ncbi:hypothetical protein CSC70_05220 [Pseudoxanthomonas kalamensis DSM 18571]|nr:hypothetical protein CSC70_05220 [Pseudoxanthomonas kalamensis DSM 18571]
MKPMMKARVLSSAIASLVFTPIGAFAQEDTSRTPVELDELVVTSEKTRKPGLTTQPITVLSGDELAHRRQGGLGETLVGLPGVHLDNFGGGASRPVIRGQTLPRIEILSDGASLFDASSVSPDHAITTDPLLLDGIEIIRGPAAVIYGGNAMNGAINLIDGRIPRRLPENGIAGAAEVRLGSGDEENTGVGRITAGLGPFAFHAEVARHHSSDYDIPGGELKDSFAESTTKGFGASWITSKGYVGAGYSEQDSEYGLPGHSHINGVCHTHGTDLHCAAHDEYDDPFGSSDAHTAYIKLHSERSDLRADYHDLITGIQHIRLRASHTDYVHDEIDGPALFTRYTNEVNDARIELTHKPLFGFTGTFGVQHTDGTFTGLNINDMHRSSTYENVDLFVGFEPPYDYVTKDTGIFFSERGSFGAFDVEFAMRKDKREITRPVPPLITHVSDQLAALLSMLYGPDYMAALDSYKEQVIGDFIANNPGVENDPLSVSIGVAWNAGNGYSTSFSLARTQRAPSVRELYAAGNNLATNSFEVGLTQATYYSPSFPASRTDVLETTKSADLTIRKQGGEVEFEVGLFHQDIQDYVFARLIETDSETGLPHNYLLYTAADATFTGLDGQISRQFDGGHTLSLFGDYVRTKFKNEDDNLPRIPPGRLGTRYAWSSGPFSADVEYYHTFSQDRIASYETKTDGYDMLNATFAYRFELTLRQSAEFYVRANNLLNELAYVHTSFVKDQSPLRGRNLVLGVRYQF